MGLFDKFSKKKKKDIPLESIADNAKRIINEKEKDDELNNNELSKAVTENENKDANSVTAETKKEENKITSSSSENQKSSENSKNTSRFTIMVENAFQLKDNSGIILAGNVHGTIMQSDKVYILHPALPNAIHTGIDTIEIGPEKVATSARDCRVAVKISTIKNINEIPKFSVITNIIPQFEVNVNKPVENPYLLGLTYEYPRFAKDAGYYNILTFAIFSSRFVSPVRMDNEPEKKADGTAVVTKNTKLGFRLLAHPNDPTLHVLPVFSDWKALQNWKDAFDGEKNPKSLILGFEECADIGLKNKAGFVINPFGPVPVYVSVDIINSIHKMKAELDKKIAEAKSKNGSNR